MKNFILVSFFVLRNAFAAELSAETNGVYLAVSGYRYSVDEGRTNGPIRFDDWLVFMPFCDSGKVELSQPLDPAYGVKIKMTSPEGRDVPKTILGARFGTRFSGLHALRDTRVYPFLASGSYKDNPHLGGARFLTDYPQRDAAGHFQSVAAKDLFKMRQPGIYTLTIQMQMFYSNPQSTNFLHKDVFRFPPITMKVEKSPEK